MGCAASTKGIAVVHPRWSDSQDQAIHQESKGLPLIESSPNNKNEISTDGMLDVEIEEDPKNAEIISKVEKSISEFDKIVKQSGKLNCCTLEFAKISDELGNYFSNAPEDDMVLRRQIAKKFATSGTIKSLCDIYVGLVSIKDKEDLDMSIWDEVNINILYVLVDHSDSVPEYSSIIVNHPEFLSCIAAKLHKESEKENDRSKGEDKCLSIMIVHNVAMVDANVTIIRNHKYVDILIKYLDHEKNDVKFIAIATLADIVNEEESSLLQRGQHTFKFLCRVFKKALEAEDRHHLGWPAWELARTTRRIAMNDTNKRALVENGCLPFLVQLAKSNDILERREAVKALWTLSFDKENQITMVTDKNLGVVEIFIEHRHSPDKETRNACEGALWTLREELSQLDTYKDLVKELTGNKKESEQDNGKGHVMISYQWSNQKLIMYIRDYLRKSGYKVWVDVDDMEGSTLQAMANAVEQASIVLVCYSRKYKDSDNCRAEAEYAFEKRKKIVPLKMEHGYKPDGWLGIIIGSKLYHDFGGKYSVESRLDALRKEIKGKYDAEQYAIVPQSSSQTHHQPVQIHSEPAYSSQSMVLIWTQVEVMKWLDKHGLDRRKFGNLDGKTISYLQYLYHQSPDFYNTSLRDHLHIKDLPTLAAFTYALDHTDV